MAIFGQNSLLRPLFHELDSLGSWGLVLLCKVALELNLPPFYLTFCNCLAHGPPGGDRLGRVPSPGRAGIEPLCWWWSWCRRWCRCWPLEGPSLASIPHGLLRGTRAWACLGNGGTAYNFMGIFLLFWCYFWKAVPPSLNFYFLSIVMPNATHILWVNKHLSSLLWSNINWDFNMWQRLCSVFSHLLSHIFFTIILQGRY